MTPQSASKRYGVPDRIIYAASRNASARAVRARLPTGIADRVRALHESEAMAG